MANQAAGRLYVVATPIGNLSDMSPRAQDTLRSCGLIAAEDTRHTGTLLKHFGIATPQLSLHGHNESARTPEILRRLLAGVSVALVSDAGTPAISDPGFELVRAAAQAGVEVVPLPGPCAAIAALSIGALPTARFCFEGFAAARPAARREQLRALAGEARTLVFYESPHRILGMLEDCCAAFGAERRGAVAREISKLHATTYRATLRELFTNAQTAADFCRGEIVLLIEGAAARTPGGDDGHDGALDRALTVLLTELPLKQAAQLAAKIAGARANEAYKRALWLKQSADQQRSPPQ